MADIPASRSRAGRRRALDIGVYALTLACLALEGDVERVGGVCVQTGWARTLRRVFLCVFRRSVRLAGRERPVCGAHRAAVCCGGGRIEIDGPL
ncbi:MAG: hypothetical protein ACLRZH_14390 [Ruthenibacterium lactatiformans]